MPVEGPFAAAAALMDQATRQGVASAIVVHVAEARGGETLFSHAVGRVSSAPASPPASRMSRFDLASVTKVFTAVAVLRLVGRGTLSLDDDVGGLLSEGQRGLHRGITVRNLLEHDAGLPAWRPLHRETSVLAAALQVPPEGAPGARHVYSDIGYLVLDAALRAATGRSAAQHVEIEVLDALGLASTGFRSVGQGAAAAVDAWSAGELVAGEICPDRGLLVGEVSDENAFALGGAAAHAGLFGPACDLAAFGVAVLRGPPLLDAEIREQLFGGAPPHRGGHLLGWDTIAPEGYTSAGRHLSPRARGHLGFTGPSLWLDPDRMLVFAVLANRVHPSRDEPRWKPLRPILHDALSRAADSVQ